MELLVALGNDRESGQDKVVAFTYLDAKSKKDHHLKPDEVVAVFWLKAREYRKTERLLRLLNEFEEHGAIENILDAWLTNFYHMTSGLPRTLAHRKKGWPKKGQKKPKRRRT